jgi:outer membrane protein W
MYRPRLTPSLLLGLFLSCLLLGAGPAPAVPFPAEAALFVSGVAPASGETALASGVSSSLRPGPGVGAAVVFFEPNDLVTRVALGGSHLPLRLSGPGGGSGGSVDLIPLSILEQRRFAPRGRFRSYVGVGLTLPFTRADLSPALRRAGVEAIRRPDHPALVVDLGTEVTLSGHTALLLDLDWVPYAETLVVVPRGALYKSQNLMLDFNPLTLSVGMAWRPF